MRPTSALASVLLVLAAVAGCGLGQAGQNGPAAAPPPQPTSATLQQSCVIESGGIDLGLGDYPPKYQVTLTNNTGGPVTLIDITTAFLLNGVQQTSDQQDATGTILEGQSLTWTYTLPSNLDTIESAGTDSGGNPLYTLNPGLTCQAVQFNQ